MQGTLPEALGKFLCGFLRGGGNSGGRHDFLLWSVSDLSRVGVEVRARRREGWEVYARGANSLFQDLTAVALHSPRSDLGNVGRSRSYAAVNRDVKFFCSR